jgi:DNA-binding XRE family transcriptional regulator
MPDVEDDLSDEEAGQIITPFAEELRAQRKKLGWTQTEFGDKAGYSTSQISAVEHGSRPPTLQFAQKCDEVTDAPGTFMRHYKRMSQEEYPPWFSPFIRFEARASCVHNWDMRGIPGLFQTEAYARAVISERVSHVSRVERKVSARMRRQAIFEKEVPPIAWCVICESVLRRWFAGADVMRDQLAHLLAMGERENVVIQVMPLSSPNYPGVDGPLTVFEFTDAPTVCYAESFRGGRTIEEPKEVADLVTTFNLIRAAALSPRESAALIEKIRSEIT